MNDILQKLKKDRWFVPFLNQQRMGFLWSIFLSFMTIVASAGLMFISGYLISRAAQRPDNILLIYVPIVLTRGFGIARPIFRYAQRLVSHNWVLRFVSQSRRRLYDSVAQTASKIRGQLQTGEVLSLLADDLDKLQNLYLRTLFPLGAGLVLYLVVTVIFGVINWLFMIWWFVMLFVILVVVPLISLVINRRYVQRQKKFQAQLYTDATDAILGLRDWISSGRQDDLVQQQGRNMSALSKTKNHIMRFGWWRDCLIQMFVLLLVIVTLIWGAQQFGHQTTEINFIAAFTLAIFPLVDSFLGVNQGISEASIYEDSMTRLNHLPETVHQQSQKRVLNDTTLELKRVTFRYAKRLIINQLDLNIVTGQKIALIGRSGSGKTTLLKLITGDVTPIDGEVTIGGYNVEDLQSQMAQVVAVLDQQAYLFDTTILNNVRMGNLSATDEQVKTAIAQAGLQPLIDQLPEGYHTPMREAGARFSGGEQQRFALARILLQDAPIVILDEPTVSLDPRTEHDVLTHIFDVLKDRTVIWVTHHLSGIDAVDYVYFLENGQFTLADTPENLRQYSLHFQKLLALDDFH